MVIDLIIFVVLVYLHVQLFFFMGKPGNRSKPVLSVFSFTFFVSIFYFLSISFCYCALGGRTSSYFCALGGRTYSTILP